MVAKTAGSLWLTPYEGKLWPIMLCDDDVPPKEFMSTRSSSYVFPAILLGKRIYKWVAYNQLQEFDPDKVYVDGNQFENNDIHESDNNEEKLEKLRRTAFTVDVKSSQTPSFWKNFIEQRSKTRKIDRVMAKKADKNRKRSREEDDDIEYLGSVPKRSSSASTNSPKAKRGRSGSKYPPTPVSNAKKSAGTSKSIEDLEQSDEELFVRESKSQSDPFTMSEDELREKNLMGIQDRPPADDMCTIFVGSEKTPFIVPRDRVGECDFLTDRVFFTEELRSHVDLSDMQHISAKEFDQVWSYMNKGDFAPRLVKAKFGGCGLEGVVLPQEKEKAAATIAKVYVTAAKVQFAALQELCLAKLKVLYPLSHHALLTVLTIFKNAESSVDTAAMDQEGREWLIDYIVEQFWRLAKHENITFPRLMSGDSEIKRSILEKLGSSPKMALEVD